MSKFSFEKKQATPEWLTSILSKNGFLSNGKVSSIEQEKTLSDMTLLSDFYSLKVKFSNGIRNSSHLISEMHASKQAQERTGTAAI